MDLGMDGMVHIGNGTFTSPENVRFMEAAISYGLEPIQFPTLAAFIAEVKRRMRDGSKR
jgi:hypothetical protein